MSSVAVERLWWWMRWAGSKGPTDPGGDRFAHFGDGALILFPFGDTFGEEHISIGTRTMVGAHVTMSVGLLPGMPLRHGAVSPVLRIGARCSIGRGSYLVAHRSVEVGDDVVTGPYCYVTDQNHVYADPDTPIGEQWPAVAPVSIGAGSWLGAGSVVLPGTTLGRNTVVAAGAVVRGEFPDHAVLAGVPAKVVRRYEEGSGWEPPLRPAQVDPAPADWSSICRR